MIDKPVQRHRGVCQRSIHSRLSHSWQAPLWVCSTGSPGSSSESSCTSQTGSPPRSMWSCSSCLAPLATSKELRWVWPLKNSWAMDFVPPRCFTENFNPRIYITQHNSPAIMNIRTFVTILSRKPQYNFPKMRGGQRSFETFPKIHPIW